MFLLENYYSFLSEEIYISDTLENLVFQLLSKNFTKNKRMVSSFYFYKI